MQDQEHFQALIEAVEDRFRLHFPSAAPIKEWKGRQIVDFQEDLLTHANGRISEKWFYTHIKSGPREKLPRVDVLNLLSLYAGFDHWEDFRQRERPRIQRVENVTGPPAFSWWKVALLVIALSAGGYVLAQIVGAKESWQLCVEDQDGNELLGQDLIRMMIYENERLVETHKLGKNACFSTVLPEQANKVVLDGPYYHRDSLMGNMNQLLQHNLVRLRKDDYALMIHYFSEQRVGDWQKRRAQLNEVFAEDAVIFQVIDEAEMIGVEMYNKAEFIDKLTTPLRSLDRLRVLQTKYEDGKIVRLRFMQEHE
ncbi:MAG: hypothetical protein AAF206_12560 [Bacteroidota bacterium]